MKARQGEFRHSLVQPSKSGKFGSQIFETNRLHGFANRVETLDGNSGFLERETGLEASQRAAIGRAFTAARWRRQDTDDKTGNPQSAPSATKEIRSVHPIVCS